MSTYKIDPPAPPLLLGEAEVREFYEVRPNKPDPERGYPELYWKGKRAFNGIHYYPAQKREQHGVAVDGWRNKLYWGDNLQVMGHLLREFRGAVDLVYIDPPFDSKADYKKSVEYRGNETESSRTAFEEKQYSDIWTNDEYLQFMYERLILVRELLAPTGSVFVHLDYRRAHHLRCILDEVFGNDRVKNEIAWCYSGGGIPTDRMPAKHDSILWYAKGPKTTYNVQYRPYSEGTVQRGRTAVKGPDAALREEGTPINDWWPDVKKITSPTDPEKLYYPTQKSEELLTRIVEMASNAGDLVLDCFMGSGTTQAVALRTGRKFIGADVNLGALQTTTARLTGLARTLATAPPAMFAGNGGGVTLYTGFEVFTVNNYDLFRNPVEARELLMESHGVRPHGSPNPWHGETGDGQDTRQIYVMPVNCIATKADLQPIIENLRWKDLIAKFRETPRRPVLRATLLCMGHEPGLGATLVKEIRDGVGQQGCVVDVLVEDVLRGEAKLAFKKESDGKLSIKKNKLRIDSFYPMNLLQKLSFERDHVDDWRKLVESVMVDFNYDGVVLRPAIVDIARKGALVAGAYDIPEDAGTICVKITDLLSDSWESTIEVDDA